MKGKPDRVTVIGVVGAALIAIAVVAGIAGTDRVFDPGPYQTFAILLERLGYPVGGVPAGGLDPAKDVVLALGDYVGARTDTDEPAAVDDGRSDAEDDSETSDEPERDSFDEAETEAPAEDAFFSDLSAELAAERSLVSDFLERGGLVISAGASGFERRAIERRLVPYRSAYADFETPYDSVVRGGVVKAEAAFAPASGATLVAAANDRAYAVTVPVGKGLLVHFADDACFLSDGVFSAEGPVLINEFLRGRWGGRVFFYGRTVVAKTSSSFFRSLAVPEIALVASLAAVVVLAGAASLAIGTEGARRSIPTERRSVLTQTRAVADFYRKNGSYAHADRFLARRFWRFLESTAPAAADLDEAARTVGAAIGADPDELSRLAMHVDGCDEKTFEERRRARARHVDSIRKRYGRTA